MSFRTRLQAFVESRQKIQIWYGMGCHNTVTGRVLTVDHDHIDIESYSHESDGQIHIRRILVPLHLILHIDITSAETEESVDDESFSTTSDNDRERSSSSSALSVIDLPEAPRGYAVRVLSQLNSSYSNRFSRISSGPGGVYFAVDGSVWFVDHSGTLTEYARIRGNTTNSGLRFDRKGILYVTTIQGTVYKIDPNKSGRVLAQLDGSLTGGGTFLADIVIGPGDEVYVSNFPSNTGGIFKIDRLGEYEVLVGGAGQGTQGLLLDDGHLWGLEHASGSIVKRTLDGREVARSTVAEPESFNFADGFDGNLSLDSLGRLYVTAGRAGTIYRVSRDGRVDTFLTGLVNPTGITFGPDGTLFVLEAGRSRVLRIVALDKAERTSSERALS
jgi:sugar lactone lactonase YvrE